MDTGFFSINHWILWPLLFFVFVMAFYRKIRLPKGAGHAYFSHAALLHTCGVKSFKVWVAAFSPYLLLIALLLSCIATANPLWYRPRSSIELSKALQNKKQGKRSFETVPVEGLGMYLVLDVSGSMEQPVAKKGGKIYSRLELLKELTEVFLSGEGLPGFAKRSHDMIGLITFARVPEVRVPLTLDRQALIEEVRGLRTVGQLERDGTAMGYALYKTMTYLRATQELASQLKDKAHYTVKGNVIVLVTDGLNNPSPLDQDNTRRQISLKQVAEYAKEHGMHVYIINVEPQLNHPMYAPQLREMRALSSLSSGQFYLLQDPTELKQVFEDIEKREKQHYQMKVAKIKGEGSLDSQGFNFEDYEKTFLYRYFTYAALGLILLYLSLEVLWIRRWGCI